MAPEGPIVDVAQRAGVSAATVSRALRNQQYVAEATRDRVLAAAQALHYVADANASRLASGRSHTVGLLAPILTSWYTSEIIVGVEEVLAEVGLDLLISTQGLPHKGNQFALASAFHQRVDGVILVDAFVHESGARELVKSSTPAVALGERLEAVPSVCIDNHLGGELGTRHLLELGHRRIALMRDTSSHDRSSTVVHERTNGYAAALTSYRLRIDESLLVDGGFTTADGRRAARRLLGNSRPPTAIFCMSDEMAFGVLQACREMGVSVPDEISVIGFDDHPVSEAVGLSTVRQSVQQMGNLAARLISECITGPAPSSARGGTSLAGNRLDPAGEHGSRTESLSSQACSRLDADTGLARQPARR